MVFLLVGSVMVLGSLLLPTIGRAMGKTPAAQLYAPGPLRIRAERLAKLNNWGGMLMGACFIVAGIGDLLAIDWLASISAGLGVGVALGLLILYIALVKKRIV